MRILNGIIPLVLTLIVLSQCNCGKTTQFVGGTSTSENAKVSGIILDDNGNPALHATVELIPSGYNPVTDKEKPAQNTTDSAGRYAFDVITPGSYSLQVTSSSGLTNAIKFAVQIPKYSATIPPCDLHIPGTIKILPSDSTIAELGYIYIPGTTIYAFVKKDKKPIILTNVPSGIIPVIYYAIVNATKQTLLQNDLTVLANDTIVVGNGLKEYSLDFSLNTSSTGANISNTVINFPVLIRLSNSNFHFNEVPGNGNTIMFTKADSTPLPFEIERWDSALGLAEIWVKVDSILSNNSTQFITMRWSNIPISSTKTPLSNNSSVFDTAQGFQAVWHMSQSGNTPVLDASPNHYNGTPYGMTTESSIPGAIGTAQKFDGKSSFIQMQGTANSSLNFPEGGTYTVSAWVCVDSPATHPELIVGKGHTQYYLRMNHYTNNSYWEFVEYHDATSKQNISDVPATTSYTWKYLVGIREGNRQRLYVDGALVMDTIRTYQYNNGVTARNTSYDVTIGKHLEPFTSEGDCFLKGIVDEVRISNKALDADWVKLCFMNQRKTDKLISVK